jgi:hypothetical protein
LYSIDENMIVSQWLALLFSIGTEAVAAACVVAILGWGSTPRAAAAAAVGTLATHWLAWWGVLRLMDPFGYIPAVIGIETGVVLAESVVYFALVPLPLGRALVISLAANCASAGLGFALYALELA